MNDDYFDEISHDSYALNRMASPLRRRALLHPMDPDALDEEEFEKLERLERDLEDL